jgi:hypothetical protein
MFSSPVNLKRCLRLLPLLAGLVGVVRAAPATTPAGSPFHTEIQPLLQEYCYDCHGDGFRKGKVAFDDFKTEADALARPDLWFAALKNVRAGLMPPDDGPRPSPAEITRLANWIKYQAFGIDPANPDPGRAVIRRLNRVEYRNTIRDLMGIDFNSEAEFPADDSGYGFDNIGDALSISPLHLEKYLQAAGLIASTAVPKVARVLQRRTASARDFLRDDGTPGPEMMNVNVATCVAHTYTVEHTENYRVVAEVQVHGSFDFDPSRCRLIFTIDGQPRRDEEIVWIESKTVKIDLSEPLTAGNHVLAFEIQPLEPVKTPELGPEPPVVPPPAVAGAAAPADPVVDPPIPASLLQPSVADAVKVKLELKIATVQINGPADEKFWIAPENHTRFFPRGGAPAEPAARSAYARDVLRRFATRAFRRPVDEAKLDQLVTVARSVYEQPGRTFEEGFAKAATVVLASPRFLFRIEPAPRTGGEAGAAPVDDYALASRLSYLFWSSMPDDELLRAAAAGELHATQAAQVARLLQDPRSSAFVRNFTGQWLQVRDVEFVPINPAVVLGIKMRRGGPRVDFDATIRRAMRTETEMAFDYVLREDRSVLELIDSNYTFLNEKLASHYGVPGVVGEKFQRVELPAGSVRGGVLTQGAVLAVTSNPTRTSPVKRGLFILDNILGIPPPPPPPNVPALEDAKTGITGHDPTLREMLTTHRNNPLCSSCHKRMDPLGLALENFNALGMWRDREASQPIQPAGQLITGETFGDVRELKHLLTHERRSDYYRCLTEKLLTYALGRGLDYHDVDTVDQIVARLENEQGRFSALLNGVIQSAQFQKQRTTAPAARTAQSLAPGAERLHTVSTATN